MKKRLFISYSTEDRPAIKSIVDRLRSGGLAGFSSDVEIVDPSAEGIVGDNIRKSILESIQSSSSVVAIWSSSASTSPWVNYELGAASALGKPMTIVLVGDEAPAVPGALSTSEIVRLQ